MEKQRSGGMELGELVSTGGDAVVLPREHGRELGHHVRADGVEQLCRDLVGVHRAAEPRDAHAAQAELEVGCDGAEDDGKRLALVRGASSGRWRYYYCYNKGTRVTATAH